MQRKKYEKEFKQMIVSLLNAGQSGVQVGRDYGLNINMILRRRREYNDKSRPCFTGNGQIRQTDQQKELARLKKENSELRLERDILKKAVGIFSESDRKNMRL